MTWQPIGSCSSPPPARFVRRQLSWSAARHGDGHRRAHSGAPWRRIDAAWPRPASRRSPIYARARSPTSAPIRDRDTRQRQAIAGFAKRAGFDLVGEFYDVPSAARIRSRSAGVQGSARAGGGSCWSPRREGCVNCTEHCKPSGKNLRSIAAPETALSIRSVPRPTLPGEAQGGPPVSRHRIETSGSTPSLGAKDQSRLTTPPLFDHAPCLTALVASSWSTRDSDVVVSADKCTGGPVNLSRSLFGANGLSVSAASCLRSAPASSFATSNS